MVCQSFIAIEQLEAVVPEALLRLHELYVLRDVYGVRAAGLPPKTEATVVPLTSLFVVELCCHVLSFFLDKPLPCTLKQVNVHTRWSFPGCCQGN
jgi:hypothetical protein